MSGDRSVIGPGSGEVIQMKRNFYFRIYRSFLLALIVAGVIGGALWLFS